MPNTNKGGQNQGQANGGVNHGPEPVGQQIREGVAQVGERLQAGFGAARHGVETGYRRAEGVVVRNPAPSLLAGFGLGFGLGVLLITLFDHEHETWADRHVPDSLRHLHVPEGIKHVPEHVHHLADAIVSHLPHSVRKYLG